MSIATSRPVDAAPPRGPETDYDQASWRESAACRDADPELFFPVGSAGFAAEQAGQAKRLCGRCPVRPQCLAYALAARQFFGIWGGYDEEERRPLHRQWEECATAGPPSRCALSRESYER